MNRRLLLLVCSVLLGCFVVLMDPLLPVRPPLSSLARIRQAGVLRVGSTGDYDPFSILDSSGTFRGIDADAARLLARAIGPNVQVQFVKTTWPTMTADLLAGRFDIAMSGVSRTRTRSNSGLLSRSYLIDAKVALIRSADKDRCRTLADLDRPEVTVVVNPGGTNQLFVATRIKKARIVIVEDNLAIPRMIAEGKGDVMFTDGVEARLSARRDPRLSVALTEPPLARIEKVYYLPTGQTELLRFVNDWIGRMAADGSCARLWAKCVGE